MPISLAAVSRVPACITVDMTPISPCLAISMLIVMPIIVSFTVFALIAIVERRLGSDWSAPPYVPVLALKSLDIYIPSVVMAVIFPSIVEAHVFCESVSDIIVVIVPRVAKGLIPTFIVIMLTCANGTLDFFLLLP